MQAGLPNLPGALCVRELTILGWSLPWLPLSLLLVLLLRLMGMRCCTDVVLRIETCCRWGRALNSLLIHQIAWIVTLRGLWKITRLILAAIRHRHARVPGLISLGKGWLIVVHHRSAHHIIVWTPLIRPRVVLLLHWHGHWSHWLPLTTIAVGPAVHWRLSVIRLTVTWHHASHWHLRCLHLGMLRLLRLLGETRLVAYAIVVVATGHDMWWQTRTILGWIAIHLLLLLLLLLLVVAIAVAVPGLLLLLRLLLLLLVSHVHVH